MHHTRKNRSSKKNKSRGLKHKSKGVKKSKNTSKKSRKASGNKIIGGWPFNFLNGWTVIGNPTCEKFSSPTIEPDITGNEELQKMTRLIVAKRAGEINADLDKEERYGGDIVIGVELVTAEELVTAKDSTTTKQFHLILKLTSLTGNDYYVAPLSIKLTPYVLCELNKTRDYSKSGNAKKKDHEAKYLSKIQTLIDENVEVKTFIQTCISALKSVQYVGQGKPDKPDKQPPAHDEETKSAVNTHVEAYLVKKEKNAQAKRDAIEAERKRIEDSNKLNTLLSY